MVMNMKNLHSNGMQLLLRRARRRFRIPENLDYYLPEDLRAAEKKFLKLCLIQGRCSGLISDPRDYHHRDA
jgi:hypothetical protein